MTSAILWTRDDDGTPVMLARITAPAPGRPAVIQPVPPATAKAVEAHLAIGIPVRGGRVLHLADGDAFVQAMPQGFRGTYLYATPVADDGPGG